MSRKDKIKVSMLIAIIALLLLSVGIIVAVNIGLEVVVATPKGDFEGEVQEITILFSKPLTDISTVSSMQNLQVSKFLDIKPALEGKLEYKSLNALVFKVNKQSLKPNTKYSVTVKAGIKSVDNVELKSPYRFNFTNDRFRVLGVNLRNQATRVNLNPDIFIHFNFAIDMNTISGVKLNSGTKDVQIQVREATEDEIRRNYYVSTMLASYRYYNSFRGTGRKPFIYKIITPTLEKNTSYKLTIENSLKCNVGEFGIENNAQLTFTTYPPLTLLSDQGDNITIEPTASIRFRFSNGINHTREDINRFISAVDQNNKPVKFRYLGFYEGSDYLYVSFMFYAQRKYTLTIKKGIKDVFGQELQADQKFEIITTDFNPYLSMPYNSDAIIENYGKIKEFPMSFLNLSKIEFKIESYNSANSFMKNNPSKKDIHTLDLTNRQKNKVQTYKFNMSKYLKNMTGFIRITMKPYNLAGSSLYNYNNNEITYFYQFTNLSILTKYSPKNIFIYVSGLKDSKKIADANISIYKDDKLIHTGKTNKEGYLIIPEENPAFKTIYKRETYNYNLKFFASKAGDFCMLTYSKASEISLYNTGLDSDSYETSMRKYYASVFTPKGLYKKNETVVIKGYIRENKGGKLVITKGKKLKVKCESPSGTKVLEKTVKTGDFGSFDVEYNIPDDPTLGRYSITVDVDGEQNTQNYNVTSAYGSFMIEAYKPREFEVNSKLGKDRSVYKNGDIIPFNVKANYMHGGIMSEAKLKYRIDAYPFEFSVSNNLLENFKFSSSSWFSEEGRGKYLETSNHAEIHTRTEDTLLADGTFNGKITSSVPFYTSARFEFGAEVEDKNRQSVLSRSSQIVHKGLFYIGYRLKEFFISTKNNLELELISVKPEGNSAGIIPVEIKIYRVEWENVRQLSSGSSYVWNSEKKFVHVKTLNANTSQDFKNIGKIKIKVDKAGSYLMTLSAKDSRNNHITNVAHFYAFGEEFVPWQMKDDQTIDLVRDKDIYAPGDVAKIMVKSPYPKIDAIVTVEREGVIDYFRTTLNGSADIVRIPIKKEYVPNVFISVVLLQGRLGNKFPITELKDIYKPTVKVGYTGLNVKSDHKKLKVKITTPKKVYEPGDKVRVNVKVSGDNNLGVKSEVSLFVVDEGVLSLISYKTPNPFVEFYKNRPLLVRTRENRIDILGQHKYLLKGENPGGEAGGQSLMSSLGLSNVSVRKIFKAIAYSKTNLITDANGNVSIEFNLPDNLTKFRIMAITADKIDRFGSAESNITVSKKLIARPALPRFLNYQDRVSAGIVVDNNSEQEGNIEVYVTSKGIKLNGANKKTIFLKKHGSQEVKFDFSAHKIGNAEFQFIAIMNVGSEKRTDIVKWTIPVKMPYMGFTVAHSSHLDSNQARERVRVPSPDEVYPETSGLEVLTASTALVNLKSAVEYLFSYPYGCLEQKMSKALPMILAGNLVKEFNVAVGIDYKKVVQEILKDLKNYQNENTGGFHTWPEKQYQYYVSPYLSINALYMMLMAKKAGYTIDEKVYNLAVKYAKDFISKRASKQNEPYSDDYYTGSYVTALYVLAELNNADESYVDSIYRKMNNMPVYTKATMVKALIKLNRTKYNEMINSLVADIMNRLKYEGDYVYFTESEAEYPSYRYFYLSTAKTSASALLMLMSYDKNHMLIPKLMKGIMKSSRNGAWRTTQENVYVFWALNTYFNIYEKDTPDFTVEIKAELTNLLTKLYKGRSLNVTSAFKLFSDITPKKNAYDIIVNKTGTGRVYYTIRLKYAPKKLDAEIDRGFSIKKQIFDSTGKTLITGSNFKAGQTYMIKLTLTNNSDRHDVVVDDPIPAGFEALNPNLERTSVDVNTSAQTGNENRSYYWWRYGFNRIEMKDDRVCLFADTLAKGTLTFVYFVKATSYGKFVMYPTKVEEMYYPEVFGTTVLKNISIE